MSGWQPAFLANHDTFFPVFTGAHDGAWNDCSECHTNSATFTEFSCLNCHEHAQPKMDKKHVGMTGYAYESTACFGCHPTGEKGDFGEHDSQYFPIFSGVHANEWSECAACHANATNRKDFTCFTCHEHNQAKQVKSLRFVAFA